MTAADPRPTASPTPAPTPGHTGAALFFDVLTDLGVEVIFGHTGGAVIPLHVELNKRMRRGEPCPLRLVPDSGTHQAHLRVLPIE